MLLADILPGLNSLLNPFVWLNDAMRELLQEVATAFQNVISNPPPPPPRSVSDYLNGNALGLAYLIVVAVSFTVTMIMMLTRQGAVRVVEGFIALVIVLGGAAIWFGAFDWFQQVGTQLSNMAMFYHPSQTDPPLVFIPDITGVLGSIVALAGILFWGFVLLMIFLSYPIVMLMCKFLGIIAIALYPLGDRAKAFLAWIISLTLVTTLLGRPFAILAIEGGKVALDTLPYGFGWIPQTFVQVGSFIVAIALQFVLIAITHKQVSRVMTTGKTWVEGTVEGQLNQKPQTDSAQSVQTMYVNTLSSVPETSHKSFRSKVVNVAEDASIFEATTKVLERVGKRAGPMGTAVTQTTSKFIQRKRGQ